VALTGEEIRARLSVFAAKWSVYDGGERSEAQSFLNELFDCYGTARQAVATFEQRQGATFVDAIWPRVCLIEMKAPSETAKLAAHRQQALDYWEDAADPATSTPSPRWVVLCSFRRLEIWEPGAYPKAPRTVLDLIDLPDQYDTLLFLAGDEPVFAGGQAALTREAVVHVVDLYEQLQSRAAADDDVLRDFLLQTVWCLFAEDLAQIPGHRFTTIVDDLIANPKRSSSNDLFGLFEALNSPGTEQHGLYADMPYANGGLFERPAKVHLEAPELEHLRSAAGFQWREVQPSIFGSLLEGGLGHDRQWTLGAHYTHEADIQKVVQPTIVEPWRERIGALTKHKDAVAAQNDLLAYVVLDPACGSGNFLYVAYRELRRIEQRLREREAELRVAEGKPKGDQVSLSAFFPLSNVKGIEIDGFAVALARVTLWMGHTLAVRELNLDESTLPLADLSGIRVGDALKLDWPRADAIIGNPPFIGTKMMRTRLTDEYVEDLRARFGVGVKDYCVYWFRKAHDHLAPERRAGLVATNSIREGGNRRASLDYVAESGGVITNAVSSQKWPGEANVHVSIVNWVRGSVPQPPYMLNGEEVSGITPGLRAGSASELGEHLAMNANHQFFGVVPGGSGFILSAAEAELLRSEPGADYDEVIRPYLVGADITNNPRLEPTRFAIDFEFRTLEQAMLYPAAIDRVRKLVKPHRDKARRKAYRERWWRFEEPIVAMRQALERLPRFIACPAQSKRIFMIWCEPAWCPSNLTSVFAFDDDFAFGLLSSHIHTRWATDQSTKLETRPRYTTQSFMSFPWPDGKREEVADLARRFESHRRETCLEQNIGLTTLYNQLDDGAWKDLCDLHRELDEAVAAAYGWPKSVAHDPDESNRRLLELNRAIAAGEVEYDPFCGR